MILVALVVAIVAAAHAVAFQEHLAGTTAFWLWLLVPYTALAALAIWDLRRAGTLAQRLTPRGGDLTIGGLSGLLLVFASLVARSVLAPSQTAESAWLLRLYIQIGDPEVLQRSVGLTLAVFVIAVAEELVWRGFVLDRVTARIGPRRGFIATTALYAAAVSPTLYVLRDPVAGPNPLLVTAAFGAGLVWTFIAGRRGRLPPAAVSHMTFSYLSAVQFRWPGI